MRSVVTFALVLLPLTVNAQVVQPKWVFSRQDPAVNEIIEFWVIVPGSERDSVDVARIELITPRNLQLWFRHRQADCTSPRESHMVDSSRTKSWHRRGARDTILHGCARFTDPGMASPIAQVHRQRPLSQAGISAVASDPITTRDPQMAEPARALLTALAGALIAGFGFLLQDVWRRWRDREDREREFRRMLFEKVSTEIWDNEKRIREFLDDAAAVPRTLSTGGYNHVLSQPELRPYLAAHRSRRFMADLGALYRSFNRFNDAEYGYHNAKPGKKPERLEQVREVAGAILAQCVSLFKEEQR